MNLYWHMKITALFETMSVHPSVSDVDSPATLAENVDEIKYMDTLSCESQKGINSMVKHMRQRPSDPHTV